MIDRFDNFWESAAGDGALSPVGVARPEGDFDALMDAWFRERQESIECRLSLDEARRLLRAFLNVDEVTPRLRRRAKHLLQTIRVVLETDRENAGDDE